jgi:hypothetical protein
MQTFSMTFHEIWSLKTELAVNLNKWNEQV